MGPRVKLGVSSGEGSAWSALDFPPPGDKVIWGWESYSPPAAKCDRRRQLSALAASEEEWVSEWQQRLSCWYEELPQASQYELGQCLAAFGNRLATVFDSSFGKSGAPAASVQHMAPAEPGYASRESNQPHPHLHLHIRVLRHHLHHKRATPADADIVVGPNSGLHPRPSCPPARLPPL